jgi:hypothetical protein
MNKKVKKAVKMAEDLGNLFNELVNESTDYDLERLFKQIEADMMDIRHKLALAAKITGLSEK